MARAPTQPFSRRSADKVTELRNRPRQPQPVAEEEDENGPIIEHNPHEKTGLPRPLWDQSSYGGVSRPPPLDASANDTFRGQKFKLNQDGVYELETETWDPDTIEMVVVSIKYEWTQFNGGAVVQRIPYIEGRPWKTREELGPLPKPGVMDSWVKAAILYCVEPQSQEEYTCFGSSKTHFRIDKPSHQNFG